MLPLIQKALKFCSHQVWNWPSFSLLPPSPCYPHLLRFLGESLRGVLLCYFLLRVSHWHVLHPDLKFMTASGNCFAEYKHIVFLVPTLEPTHPVIVHPPSPQEKAQKPSIEACPLLDKITGIRHRAPQLQTFPRGFIASAFWHK